MAWTLVNGLFISFGLARSTNVVGRRIVKTDQEPSTLAVAKEIKRLRLPLQSTLLESSKTYDSQSNGVAERAAQSVECQVRTVLIALQKRLEVRVPVTHTIVTWLVEHAADLLNKFALQLDQMAEPHSKESRERSIAAKWWSSAVRFSTRSLASLRGA